MEWSSSSAGTRATARAAEIALLGVWSLAASLAVAQGRTPGKGSSTDVPSSSPQYLTVCGDRVLFSADNGVYGRELWGVDTAGLCRLAVILEGGPAGGNPRNLVSLEGGNMPFVAETSDYGRELWIWNEATQSCRILKDFMPGPESSDASIITVHGKKFLVVAKNSANDRHAVFGVTVKGMVALLPIPVVTLVDMPTACPFADASFIVGSNIGLWLTDGSPEGTVVLEDTDRFAQAGLMTPVRDKVVFRAKDAEHGRELWTTDGTPAGAHLIQDIFPGPSDSSIGEVTDLGDVVCFQADDGTHGLELWVTDGTVEGTRLAADIAPDSVPSDPHYFTRAGSFIFFCANDGQHGTELYRSDLTANGTSLVADLVPGPVGSQPWSLVEFRGRLFFCATSQQYGEEVFVTDGTPQGTRILKDIVPGVGHSGPDNLTNLHDSALIFSCNDVIHGEELWLTDGTAAGTRLAADLWMHEKQRPASSRPAGLTALAGRVMFAATDPDHGTELWVSDGTNVGTHVIADLNPGPEGSNPREMTASHGRVYFAADTSGLGSELWRTDGTGQGTAAVADLAPGPMGSQPRMLTAVQDSLYFTADDGVTGCELWRCGPDVTSPTLAAELTPGARGSSFGELFELWGQLFLYVTPADGDLTLWWYDSAAGTAQCILDSVPMTLLDAREGTQESDGSVSALGAIKSGRLGKSSALLVKTVHPPHCEENGTRPVTLGATTFFVNHAREYGTELWATDGTWADTRLVADVYPGPGSSSPSALLAVDDRVFFAAEAPQDGRILYKTDGTTEGTSSVLCVRLSTGTTEPIHRVQESCYLPPNILILAAATPFSPFEDIELLHLDWGGGGYTLRLAPSLIEGNQSARPRELTAVGNAVCFVAEDPIYGEELWRVEPATMVSRIISEGGSAAVSR
ncbi:MAG: hypothetical protein IT365_14680 [Candidatus Hydrogenedentes bacterium]|nr:hypothetical protein [Candidatus Hydrogenedentota bacterium]